MRLTNDEVCAVKQAIEASDPSAEIYLFGSRVDESLRGGDIDLLVISDAIDSSGKLDLLVHFEDMLGEQKIDLLVRDRKAAEEDPFIASIRKSAVRL